jgi:hypothetical protein
MIWLLTDYTAYNGGTVIPRAAATQVTIAKNVPVLISSGSRIVVNAAPNSSGDAS